ncbi:sigma-54 dependent transcriptional regulator [Thermotoga sp. SG1]|uniref:sigma-54-dependent transcriptional regulator n=1 Tax=Thermotoga sp. SG1 TaxID=126739 RepID=UPI000C765CEF|nr:sigma 54-interacting transcriptional regulator [Thermotoga sp. SG1]PLV57140.1 hypothetical protein AS006_02260 [Thermotoga sp. SG1]
MSSRNSKVDIVIFFRDTNLKDVVSEILKNLKEKVAKDLGKPELERFEVHEKLPEKSQKIILITDDPRVCEHYKKDFERILFFVEKSIPSSLIDHLIDYPVSGIFSKKNFMTEYEEKGKFEARVKEIIRDLLEDEIEEKEIRKSIDWKYSAEDRGKKFVSLFLDPAMEKTVENIRYIIRQLRIIYEKLKLVEILKERKKIMNQWEKSGDQKWKSLIEFSNFEKYFEQNYRIVPSVLIEGPTGSGKTLLAELIARSIYENIKIDKVEFSDFYSKISILNLGNLVETELFGSAEGSFTDSKDYPGEFLSYSGGVVFLDEIGELPPETQAKLLLYLDNLKVRPLGRTEQFFAPTIIIAATNKDLEHEITKGTFRTDLYRRFLFRIKLPSLNERKEDFRLLISFVLSTSPYNTGNVRYISMRAIKKLEKHNFTGNFRELEEILSNALIKASIADRDIILEKDLDI